MNDEDSDDPPVPVTQTIELTQQTTEGDDEDDETFDDGQQSTDNEYGGDDCCAEGANYFPVRHRSVSMDTNLPALPSEDTERSSPLHPLPSVLGSDSEAPPAALPQ